MTAHFAPDAHLSLPNFLAVRASIVLPSLRGALREPMSILAMYKRRLWWVIHVTPMAVCGTEDSAVEQRQSLPQYQGRIAVVRTRLAVFDRRVTAPGVAAIDSNLDQKSAASLPLEGMA